MKTLIIMVALAASFMSSHADFVVSPFAAGNSASAIPFLTDSTLAPSVRYQQVYRGSDFFGHGGLQYQITELSFEGGAGSSAIDVTLPNLQIELSTTLKAADGLSSQFAQNIGLDETLVYSGSAHLSANGFESFGIHIPLQHPFVFDPFAGNLLLDVRNYEALPLDPLHPFRLLASENTTGDSVSRAVAFDVNSPTASLSVDSAGLVTLFTVNAVPEPSSVVLIGLGLVSLACAALHRRFSSMRREEPLLKGRDDGPH